MSRIRANTITDMAGTGKPSFTNGLYSAGDVGIGDNAPSSDYGTNLSVHSTATDGARLKISDGTTGKGNLDGLDIISTGGVAYFINRETADMSFSAGAGEKLRITSGGLIDISGGVQISENVTPTTGSGVEIFKASSTVGQIQVFNRDSSAWMDLALKGKEQIFYTAGTERVRIDSSGNVVIGATSGQGLFSVHQSTSATSNYINITNNATGTPSWSNGMLLGNNTAGDALCWQNENLSLVFGTNNIERMRILSGGGLTFNGDTAAANALDDYEEGDWTPTITSGGSAIGTDSNDCKYVKVGNLVCCHFEVGAITSPTGSSMVMGGLPFTPNNEGGFPMSITHADFGTGYTYLSGHFQSSSGSWGIFKSGSSQPWVRITGSEYTNAAWFGTIVYRTS